MRHIIHNHLCRCGSGLSPQDCCHRSQHLAEKEIWFAEANELASQMEKNLVILAKRHYHPEVKKRAWEEFTLHEEGTFSKKADHKTVFLSWFLYNWIPGEEDILPGSPVEIDIPVAAAYLILHRDHIQPEEIRFVETILDHPFSFFEVVQTVPGRGCWMKDLFLEDECLMDDPQLADTLKAGDIIFARLVNIGGVVIRQGYGERPMPPVYRSYLMELKVYIENEIDEIIREDLFEWAADLRALYLDIHFEMNSTPILKNADGDHLCMHELFFDVESAVSAFESLKSLSDQTDDEILEHASYDKMGQLSHIEFEWTMDDGTAQHSPHTLFGHISIKGTKLIVSVNSRSRAESAKTSVLERLGTRGKYKTTRVQSIVSLMKTLDVIDQTDTEDQSIPVR